MLKFVFIGCVVLLLVLLIAKAGGGRSTVARGARLTAKSLLTRNEKLFFEQLARALPSHYIFPQVSMGALMTAKGGESGDSGKLRNQFNRKIVDFVVADSNLDVVALIELDDASHNNKRDTDAARDRMTAEAGFVTLRYESRSKPTAEVLRRDILKLRPTAATGKAKPF
ncbi:DUF2726 domain-containing protein [Paraburkholderia sp. UCT31]|uniref:DUF2726 domain-containing protein n=1 Tax=Paraburkholderia sp. UCT31 TaxID=2615209 RepID=UPI0016562CCC|nr:DUF2726 domain-containing protein [Paraburkholderia sp. UCT31]MBC8737328.1 DUF2726 domain-containing protein [Paraburkholderia sp. UCT31]